jgi:cyclophilin family peptidyl-prolyl cis-trans isomerase
LPVHLLLPKVGVAAAILALPLATVAAAAELPDGLYAEITTPRGVITCELEASRAPLTVTNFVGLAEGTLGPAPRKPFFNGLKFHRVVPGFVIQGGDPLGTGEGGPGYAFPDEFGPGLSLNSAGVLAMANSGPDTNGSQFFITLEPEERLDFMHSVFGKVVRGMKVPAKVVQGDPMTVRILRIGAAARVFRADDRALSGLLARAPGFPVGEDSGPSALFLDPDRVLPVRDPPLSDLYNLKLKNYERATGRHLFVRIFARFRPPSAGVNPEEACRRLYKTLGIPEPGALAVYFSDQNQWRIFAGPGLAGALGGSPGLSRGVDSSPSEADSINDLLTHVEYRRRRYEAQVKTVLTNFLQVPGEPAKISTDALIDEMLFKISR